MFRLFLILVIIFLVHERHFASNDIKYGKLSKDDIQYDQCSFDPEAGAVYLYHKGEINVSNLVVLIKKHIRIKVLKESGIKHANIHLPYYSKEGYEKFYSIKAQTINVDADGKLSYIEVDKKSIFEAQLSDEWKEKRFTFPNVKVGSILEYEYTISSENHLYLDHWDLQHELPTLYSGLSVDIPQYLDYQLLLQGYRLSRKYKDKLTNRWELTNLPAIKEEPFLYNQKDFVEKIQFQLSGYYIRKQMGGTEYKSLRRSWESLAEEVLTSHEYRSYLGKSGFAKEVLNSLHLNEASSEDKIKALYNYVITNYQWNGKYRRFTYNKLSDISEKSEAYSSEINLLLTLLLNEAGIEAYPMLISTRSNGDYMKDYPFLTQFNHLIVYAKTAEQTYFLDALDPFRPFNVLPVEDHISEGFVLDKKNPRWEPVKLSSPSKEVYRVVLTLTNGEIVKGQMAMESSGLSAVRVRRKINSSGENKWFRSIARNSLDEIDSLRIENHKEIDEILSVKGDFSLKNTLAKGTGTTYLNPFILDEFRENPFKNDTRYYPVQFANKYSFHYWCSISIPDNFEVIELPKSERVRLPNNYGDFSYIISGAGSDLMLNITFNINELELPSVHYGNLKEFYNIIISKLNQPIVLKNR